MRKRIVMGGLAALLVSASPPAWAVSRFDNTDSQYPFETTMVQINTDSVGNFGGGVVIYGFRLIADDAGDTCTLLDRATVGTGVQNTTQGAFIDDIGQDTDNRSVDSDWPRPYVLSTDLSVITSGICVIYHSPL